MVRKSILFFVVVAMAMGIYAGMRRSGGNHVGSVSPLRAAPDLSLIDLNGDTLRTSNYKGKVVLVNFWAAWCTPCAEEIPQFIALQKKYHDQGLQVIGFSVEDDAGELRDFYRKHQMNYPVVPSDLKIADGFGGVLGLPTTFLIGKDNLIHGKHNGATDFSALEQEVVALLHAPQS
ncbi:MAG TPA: TlpA disulfide reductase family protein [Candidatus Angelobacter sp.]|jgi:peroxiredoxin